MKACRDSVTQIVIRTIVPSRSSDLGLVTRSFQKRVTMHSGPAGSNNGVVRTPCAQSPLALTALPWQGETQVVHCTTVPRRPKRRGSRSRRKSCIGRIAQSQIGRRPIAHSAMSGIAASADLRISFTSISNHFKSSSYPPAYAHNGCSRGNSKERSAKHF